jgi:hypothetical protein
MVWYWILNVAKSSNASPLVFGASLNDGRLQQTKPTTPKRSEHFGLNLQSVGLN